MKWLHFILSHSIFISLCAAALCFQTFYLLSKTPEHGIYILVFCSTLASYNLYWLISKYHFAKNREIKPFFVRHFSNLILFLLASVGVIACILMMPEVIPYVLIAVVLTLLYSLPLWPQKSLQFLRNAGFVKTLLLSFTWTYVTVMIPLRENFFSISRDTAYLFIARFAFMLMLCTIFDSRDINVDKIHGLRSLATDVGRRTLKVIMLMLFIFYVAAGSLLRFGPGSDSQLIAFFITGLVVMFVYLLSLKKQGYIFYYFVVDGLMLFSAVATYVASI